MGRKPFWVTSNGLRLMVSFHVVATLPLTSGSPFLTEILLSAPTRSSVFVRPLGPTSWCGRMVLKFLVWISTLSVLFVSTLAIPTRNLLFIVSRSMVSLIPSGSMLTPPSAPFAWLSSISERTSSTTFAGEGLRASDSFCLLGLFFRLMRLTPWTFLYVLTTAAYKRKV